MDGSQLPLSLGRGHFLFLIKKKKMLKSDRQGLFCIKDILRKVKKICLNELENNIYFL
jgi:hypothetical protein